MTNNYDSAAWFYDAFSKLIFGNAIKNIQTALLPHIPPNAKILVVGGGTGWILDEIHKVHSSGLEITYVEISSKMLNLAKKRRKADNVVHFVNKPIENYKEATQYDIIFTAFLFDNFGPNKIESNFLLLHNYLKSGGLWLFADFHIGKTGSQYWQKTMLKCMLTFFRILCNVEAKSLIWVVPTFDKNTYKLLNTYSQLRQFMIAFVYQKSSTHTSSF